MTEITHTKTFLWTLLVTLAVGAAVVPAGAAASSGVSSEVVAEEAGAAAEAREDSATAAFDATASEADPEYAAKLERLETRIVNLRSQKEAIYELPHHLSTGRYRTHRWRKHLRIILCRKQIELLRKLERLKLEIASVREQMAAETQAGETEDASQRRSILAERRAQKQELKALFAQREHEIAEQARERHE